MTLPEPAQKKPPRLRRHVAGTVILLIIVMGGVIALIGLPAKSDVGFAGGLGKLSANPVRRALLVGWAERDHVNEGTFKDALDFKDTVSEAFLYLPHILRQYLQGRRASDPQRIEGAQAFLQQMLNDPDKRPVRADLSFERDSNGNLSILKSNRKAFPSDLESAFFSLERNWDPYDLMLELSQLDHPYLATYAGLWLFSTFHFEQAHHGLRFAMDENGLPNLWLIHRLDYNSFGDDMVLIGRIIEHGDDALFAAIVPVRIAGLSLKPEQLDLVIRRASATPDAVARLGIDIDSVDAGNALATTPEFASLLRINNVLLQMLLSSGFTPNADAGSIAESYAARPEVLWNLVAMHLWSKMGDGPRTREMALRLSKSTDEGIQAEAAEKLRRWRSAPKAGNGDWSEVEPGVIADSGSTRQWTRQDSKLEMTPDEADDYCRNLPSAGANWHLPELKELHLIFAPGGDASTPCGGDGTEITYCRVPTEFLLSGHEFWSDTYRAGPNLEPSRLVMSISLVDGEERGYDSFDETPVAKQVLCVRDAPDEE